MKSVVLAVLVQRLLQGHSPLQSWAVACSWKGRWRPASWPPASSNLLSLHLGCCRSARPPLPSASAS